MFQETSGDKDIRGGLSIRTAMRPDFQETGLPRSLDFRDIRGLCPRNSPINVVT
jgi:hypothetical protein